MVDSEIDLGRALDRQVAWLRAPQDAVDVLGSASQQIGSLNDHILAIETQSDNRFELRKIDDQRKIP